MVPKISITLLILSLGLATNAHFFKGWFHRHGHQGKKSDFTVSSGSPSIEQNGGTGTQVASQILPTGEKVEYKYDVVTNKDESSSSEESKRIYVEKIISKPALVDQANSDGYVFRGPANTDNNDSSGNSGRLEEIYDLHNAYRSKHQVPHLTVSSELAKLAQDWADTLGRGTTLYHRPETKYGENIYWTSDPNGKAVDAVKDWYKEISSYNFDNPGYSSDTGHFTQVVWKSSSEIGCGKSSGVNGLYIVCNYSPTGNMNMPGYFEENVLRPN